MNRNEINRDSATQLNELAVQLLRKLVNVTFWSVMEPLPWVWTWSCSDYPKERLFGSVRFTSGNHELVFGQGAEGIGTMMKAPSQEVHAVTRRCLCRSHTTLIGP